MSATAQSVIFAQVEAEFEKDIWDVRNIPGSNYPACRSEYLLNFTYIPVTFRPNTKRYMRLLVTKYSLDHCRSVLRYLRIFCVFFAQHHPKASGWRYLSRADIECYLLYLKTQPSDKKERRGASDVNFSLSALKQFLQYLERIEAPEAPTRSSNTLIWESDVPRKPSYYRGNATVKYIPSSVLQQLDTHLPALPACYLNLAIILRASGWRISDVLNLRLDTCLEKTGGGWWLCGDIHKTQVLNHRVPLSDEVAVIVQTQCTLAKQQFATGGNPQGYVFPALTQKRRGLPLHADNIRYQLNRLAKKYRIRDDMGQIFVFKTHAFRHTKAVELINNGMSLVLVQKWLAHASPEMTLVYAKLLDPTMRKAWEDAFAQGAVRIDEAGKPHQVAVDQLDDEDTIQWEYLRHNLDAVRLPNGYCFKPKKADCPTQATPCYSCHHFCTTPAFLPQFEQEVLEMHQLIEMGEKVGSVPWVERNRQKLDKLLPVIQVLREGKVHHPAGKAIREYPPEERDKRYGA